MTSITEDEKRSEYIAGLRALADLLEAHDEMPLPYGCGTSDEYASMKMSWYVQTKERVVALARILPGRLDKRVDDAMEHYGFELHGSLLGLHYLVNAPRAEMCTRKVVGHREVTKEVPTATETVTVVEDIVEWECSPLLAEARA